MKNTTLRSWLTLLVALAFSGLSFAQPVDRRGVTLSTKAAIEAFGSSDASVRERARLEVERHPGAFAPPVFPALGEALIQEGQDQQALRWWYFGYVRAVTEGLAITKSIGSEWGDGSVGVTLQYYASTMGPGLRDLLLAPPPQGERLLDEAIELDGRTPRLYSLDWVNETNFGRVWNDRNPTWSDDELLLRTHLPEAREQTVALTRAEVHKTYERQRLTVVANNEVDAGRVATEATLIIQSEWRERIRPLRSLRLDCDDATPLAAPRGANSTDFALICGGFVQFTERVIWLRSADGERIADTPFSAVQVDRERLLVRNGRLLVPDMLSRNGELRMVGVSGAVESYRPPDWTLPNLTIADISPSGRFMALRGNPEDIRSIYVVDLDANRVVWLRDGFNHDPRTTTPETENFAFLWERGGQVVPAIFRRSGCTTAARCVQSHLVLIDIANDSEQVIRLPRAMARSAELYGDQAAMVRFVNVEEDPRPVSRAVIALAGSAPPQLVHLRENEPMPTATALCATRQIVTAEMTTFASFASVTGGTFKISAPERSGLRPNCAVSGDGKRLIVVARPFVHLYAIE